MLFSHPKYSLYGLLAVSHINILEIFLLVKINHHKTLCGLGMLFSPSSQRVSLSFVLVFFDLNFYCGVLGKAVLRNYGIYSGGCI